MSTTSLREVWNNTNCPNKTATRETRETNTEKKEKRKKKERESEKKVWKTALIIKISHGRCKLPGRKNTVLTPSSIGDNRSTGGRPVTSYCSEALVASLISQRCVGGGWVQSSPNGKKRKQKTCPGGLDVL